MSQFPDYSKRKGASSHATADELFVERWSPRAFEKVSLKQDVLERIFDAARWSPSCFNAQPWRFYTSNESNFDEYLDLLVEGNQAWAKDASVIGFAVAQKHFTHNGKPNDYAQFDTGAAWMSLSLQARKEGLYTHGMGGIHKEKAEQYLQLDTNDYEVVMGFVIGLVANPDTMDEETLDKETPNERLSLDEIWIPS